MKKLEVERKAAINSGARALRRYVVARAANHEFGEWVRYDYSIKAWVFCTEAEAKFNGDIPSYRVRSEKMPWCKWLGNDTRIADDYALAAFFECHVTQDFGWSPFRSQVQRSPTKSYVDWRRKGRQLLNNAKAQRLQVEIAAESGPTLADEFESPGQGLHDIPCAKRKE